MVRQNTLKAGLLVAVTLGLSLFAADPSALAQQRLQTPEGRQTVAPSDMPQQPTLNEDFANPSKQNTMVVPPAGGSARPGIPGIESPGRKATTGPGMIKNGNMDERVGPVQMQPQPAQPGQQPTVNTPRTGGIVLPEGIPSSVRIGPVEPVPIWERAMLALFLTVNLAVISIIAVAMQIHKRHYEDEFQHGHTINPDYREPLVHRRGTL